MNIARLEAEYALDIMLEKIGDNEVGYVENFVNSFEQLTDRLDDAECESARYAVENEELRRDLGSAYELLEKGGLVKSADRKAVQWALIKHEAPK
jgi:hypothetical protein